MIKVSVIVPLYKVEQYIDKCVNSVLNQTLQDIEIILVNDGSPDKCGIMAEEYRNIDDRIKVIHKENGGLSSARNAGIDIATGEFIAFIDADDWIEPNMLETMYENAVKNKADLSICNYNRVFESYIEENFLNIKEEVIDIREIGLKDYFYKYYFNYTHGDEACNKIFKRSIIEKNGIRFEKNSEIFAEDKLFNLYYIMNVKKVTTSSKSFYNYLQRQGSLMNSPKPNLMTQYVNLIEKFILYARNSKKDKEIRDVYPFILADLINGSIYHLLNSGADTKKLKVAIEKAAEAPNYRGLMLRLSIGRCTNIYCKKTQKKLVNQINMRVFGLLNSLNLYGLISYIMFEKFKKSTQKF